ncbi:2-oxo acid dehydrogenase subunit E2 [Actinomadura sp. DC4]|uniref:2-oxo acid dehydrogenase subunit E2 n=1 Tax=Actinomadura sp. DC4 TaxID=3055069 RepID=UPI0025B2221E|nr:2-oxo acid dehydrogenase subunit E2 [Actinomadura sp. DC4]MDN3358465.1 2-oxo acid dehydrogenase subunit E2 [Actinomadura sp. DC4]
MAEIRVPKLNNNDQEYTLTEWLAGDEEPIEPGTAVVALETSKAAEEIGCDEGGVLWHGMKEGALCEPGAVIGWVVPPGTPRTEEHAVARPGGGQDSDQVVTEPARRRMEELGVDPARVRELDRTLVRAADVERLAETGDQGERGGPAGVHTVPAVQAAVGRMVGRSHREIPAAYTVMKIDVGAAQEAAARLGRRLRKPVGLPEFLIAAVAPLHARFPLFFAAPADDRSARLPDDAHVGVTVDRGDGLYVPVIKNASTRTLEEIVEALREFRASAAKGAFREQDLTGGNISVALHHNPGVVLAIPFVFPGQTCCLALASAQSEVALDDDGRVTARTVANLGLAYDHRFVNGGQAVAFLEAVKESLEAPS